MSKELKLIKEINHLMLVKYIEIFIALLIIVFSIPIWHLFATKISDLDFFTNKDLHLKFREERGEKVEKLSIINDYTITKNYKVYLITDKSINLKTKIIINKTEFNLKDFNYEILNNKLQFTIIDKSILSATDLYTITIPSLNNNEYEYIFEEFSI